MKYESAEIRTTCRYKRSVNTTLFSPAGLTPTHLHITSTLALHAQVIYTQHFNNLNQSLSQINIMVQISTLFIFVTLAITPLLAAPLSVQDIQSREPDQASENMFLAAREPRRFGAGGRGGRRFGRKAAAPSSEEAREFDDNLETREARYAGGHAGNGGRKHPRELDFEEVEAREPGRGGRGFGGGRGRRFGRKAAPAASEEARDLDGSLELVEARSRHYTKGGGALGHNHRRELDFEEVEAREPRRGGCPCV
ncbi:hypothetical protein CPB83DRAFT_903310 [Crepidotus variabilis]|uniref:Uncharacterized protein n=1 Tax=Crepidotus variabilis TaxID=179855 RepID=A0A9P6EPA7_9AGAR|nr:hypothetical protein CPB83DRAFT_903310 [Crepidotus variabilis]